MTNFSSLADELLLHVASFLAPVHLLRLECLSTYTYRLDTDALWRNACQRRWEKWPRYRLTSERMSKMNRSDPRVGWKEQYRIVERDVIRTEVTMEELEELSWYFNYTRGGGLIAEATLLKCFFKDNFLFLEGYPPLPVQIKEEMPPRPPIRADEVAARPFSKRQWLKIADFNPHFISRTSSNAEWLIINENVTFVSCDKEGSPSYVARSST